MIAPRQWGIIGAQGDNIMLLGCIADDFTGATDLAATLVRAGMRTVQEIKSAIEQLSLETRAELIADLCGWSDDDWDLQMKTDAAAGKFGALNEEADQAGLLRTGQSTH
jgi:hypothetical protein